MTQELQEKPSVILSVTETKREQLKQILSRINQNLKRIEKLLGE